MNEDLLDRLGSIRRDLPPPYTAVKLGTPPRFVVLDHSEGSSLYARGFYGKPVGIKKPDPFLAFDRELMLDPLEVVYLMEKGWLRVVDRDSGRECSIEEVNTLAEETHEHFHEKSLVFKDLRDKGYIVRPGLKFGADFTVYKEGPGIDHSSFVVQVLEHENQISAIDIVRAGRLATSVKKRFVIASISTNMLGDPDKHHIDYYVFKWYRP